MRYQGLWLLVFCNPEGNNLDFINCGREDSFSNHVVDPLGLTVDACIEYCQAQPQIQLFHFESLGDLTKISLTIFRTGGGGDIYPPAGFCDFWYQNNIKGG